MRGKCSYSELFWSAFSRFRTESREILGISPYSVQTRENADQNSLEYGVKTGKMRTRITSNMELTTQCKLWYDITCNCNAANINVVALYLSERLNNNLYYTLKKLIISGSMYIFLSAIFFLLSEKKSPNAVTREKANSLIVKLFILMKVQSLDNAYY